MSKCLVLLKMNTCSTRSTSWRINCGINWMCTWIYTFDFIANIFFHCRIFLVIRPLPSGKAKHTMMSMHSSKQVHGACGIFGWFSKATKKSWMSDKGVAKFWHMNYLFWNLCFQINLWTCNFSLDQSPLCNNTLILVDPSFLILFPREFKPF